LNVCKEKALLQILKNEMAEISTIFKLNIKMTKAFHKYYHLIVDEDFSMFLASK
jgi:hypothetical protein